MTSYELIVLENDGTTLRQHSYYEEYEWDSALRDWLRFQGSSDVKAILSWAGEEYDDRIG